MIVPDRALAAHHAAHTGPPPGRYRVERHGDVWLVSDAARMVVTVVVFPHGPGDGGRHVRLDVTREAIRRHPDVLAWAADRCARRLLAARLPTPRSDLLRTP